MPWWRHTGVLWLQPNILCTQIRANVDARMQTMLVIQAQALLLGSDVNARGVLQFVTKPTGRKSAPNPPLLSANIREERLPPARASISISFSPPVTSLLGNHRESWGGLALEEHRLREYERALFIATATEQ